MNRSPYFETNAGAKRVRRNDTEIFLAIFCAGYLAYAVIIWAIVR